MLNNMYTISISWIVRIEYLAQILFYGYSFGGTLALDDFVAFFFLFISLLSTSLALSSHTHSYVANRFVLHVCIHSHWSVT